MGRRMRTRKFLVTAALSVGGMVIAYLISPVLAGLLLVGGGMGLAALVVPAESKMTAEMLNPTHRDR
jgi:hypothetical protein